VSVPHLTRVDHVVIAVRDLASASTTYEDVLGLTPSWRGSHPRYGTANVVFGLTNCYLELLALDPTATAEHPLSQSLAARLERQPERLFALAFGTDDLIATADGLARAGLEPGPIEAGEARDSAGRVRRWRSCLLPSDRTRGVGVLVIQHDAGSEIPPARPTGGADAAATAVDHVVLFSDDLAGALALWRDTLGISERWRREFSERSTVNVGLRLGGVTLELVGPLDGTPGTRGERLWGIAYHVPDCDRAVERIRAAGMAVSGPRPGLAPRTWVATVKWDARVPTLLIERRKAPPERGEEVDA